ncbi:MULTISPECIES: lipopolysaccharide assembly protein LapB [unclassified Pasteurella]|uniref:tetratricopeptide repeat protein n=1 Tax=unclassified Pasteurella TaxID=2621516 RepID=UPI00107369EE|nr:tetratricopeptide repeat protein [Pasteurella sp. 19428wF3_WM03]TFU50572.1 tetratricopeptide repeat protein [Pasteurella sp. WM03]
MYHLLERARCGELSGSWNDDEIYCSRDLADIYFEIGKYDKARTIYEKILEYEMDNMSSLSGLAQIYYKGLGVRQDLEKAKEYYGKLCDLKEQKYCDLFREVNEKIR